MPDELRSTYLPFTGGSLKRKQPPKRVTSVKLEPLDMTVDPGWEFKKVKAGDRTYIICPKCNCWTGRRSVPCDHDLTTPIPEAIQRAGVYIKKSKPKE